MVPRADLIPPQIKKNPGRRTRELARHFGVADEEFDSFVQLLFDLQENGQILRVPREGWELPERTPYRVGTLRFDRRGTTVVRVAARASREDDVFVRERDLRDGFPGDLVLVRIQQARRGGRLAEGASVVEYPN